MRPRLNPRYLILTVICLGLTSLVSILYWNHWFFDRTESASRDWLLTNGKARRLSPDPRIVFLALDENTRSLDAVFADDFEKSATLRMMKGGFPWNRQVWADIIDRLANAGAKAIVLDLIFPGPREGDDAFRAALERHRDRVVIGTHLVREESERADTKFVSVPQKHILPTPELCPPPGSPSWLGFTNVFPDSDDLIRRIYYRTTLLDLSGIPTGSKDQELYSLAARGLEKAGFSSRIPHETGQVMFRFSEDVRPKSLYGIFVDSVWDSPAFQKGEFFRDKIVLIGQSEQAAEDRLQTPLGVTIASQVHLSAMNAALNGEFLHETTQRTNLLLIVGGGALAWAVGAWVRRPVLRLGVLALLALAYQQVAQNGVNELGIVPILFSPLLSLCASGITWAAFEQVADRIERNRTRRALERYVGHDVAGEVLDNPASYLDSLGGKRKEVTILFSDIRGFTTLTESADAHQLVTQLNEYFTEMVAIVFAQQGTLDKFIGDAVMAHWGGIVSAGPETDAVRAVTTALEMCEALKKLNADWKTRGITEWAIGIGLNHGAPITGNIGASGARERFDFTVVGDAVNLASRLEGTTKNYHIELCIGESVAALVRNQFPLRSVDLIIVKGKTKPVEIFTVLGKQGTPAPSWLPAHDEAMRCYRAGEFAAAEAAWRQVLEQVPGDGLTETMLARCAELQTIPPPTPWTGVYEMKSK